MTATDHAYGGRYKVIESVGAGGMAEVYRARDELLGREVALKVLSPRLSDDPSFIERFRREARSAANLSHPNVVSLYDYGSDDGSYYIVMEFIDGEPLSDIIRREGPLMPERAADIASSVSKALGRAHDSGLVHRDVKPANIMITRTGETKVTDFGIARAATADGEATVTQTGMVIGTASYLSPEQAQGSPVDGRSDVYSLGCVLYEMLTGEPPFAGESPLSVAYKHVREDPIPPSSRNPDVPAALDAIVLKAMAKNPDNRFTSATEIRDDLDRFLAGQRVHATPVLGDETAVAPRPTGTEVIPEAYEEEEPSRRRAALYVIAALVILGLFALLAFLLARNFFATEPVTVPDVVGMQQEEAIDTLEELDLRAEVEARFSPRPEGQVVDQDPEAGEEVQTRDTVTIFVSQGRRPTTVPDLRGMTLPEAEEALEDANLSVGVVTEEESDEVEAGRVIRHDPGPGEEEPRGTAVDLVVSAGPEEVRVPHVVGLMEQPARDEIEAAGLRVEVTREPSDEEEGRVVAQDPEGGTEVARGSTVRITVSTGPAPQPMPDVTGENADQAQGALEDEYGLQVARRPPTGPCAEPPGHVCSQSPDPGTSVRPGDRATLFVQQG